MRRRLLAVFAGLLPLATFGAPVAGIVVLEALVKVLGDAGEALSKVAKGISDAVVSGVRTYDYVATRRVRTRLIDISSRLTGLIIERQSLVVTGIDEYIALATKPQRTEFE